METYTFDNVAMYRTVMFGVSRVDCKSLTIITGQKYAQYNEAIRVQYLEKGKRKVYAFILTDHSWLRVFTLKDAIKPFDPMAPTGDGGRISRYTSFDPRYVTEFEDAIAHLQPLYSFGLGARDGAHRERCLEMDNPGACPSARNTIK